MTRKTRMSTQRRRQERAKRNKNKNKATFRERKRKTITMKKGPKHSEHKPHTNTRKGRQPTNQTTNQPTHKSIRSNSHQTTTKRSWSRDPKDFALQKRRPKPDTFQTKPQLTQSHSSSLHSSLQAHSQPSKLEWPKWRPGPALDLYLRTLECRRKAFLLTC